MPLQAPKLDDRKFDDLVKEARARIPRYLPDWTDWNESDPGITLLQLHAWLTETILYRLNQLPELNYIKFLQLLGVEQRPAQPAQADLTFILEENPNLVEILIEKRTLVGVSSRDLEEPLFFETERTLTAISARLALLITVDDIQASVPQIADVTQDNEFDGRTFTPFGEVLSAGENHTNAAQPALLLGFSSTLPFSREEIGLQFYLAEEGKELLAESPGADCGPEIEDPDAPQLAWSWWDGVDWDDLDVTGDETRNLTQSGQVYFRVPGQIPAVPYASLGLPAFQEEEEEAPLYYWLRVVFRRGTYAKAPKIDRVLTNTVRATAAQTVFDEAVGSSDGTPNQTMKLRHRPALAEPPLQLEVDEGSGSQPWKEVSDFYDSGPSDANYVLNSTTGEITFGDGRHGRIPVAGQFNVVAREYRYGGGRVGNVGAGTITDLSTPIDQVEEVTNYRPAEGGADEESLSDTLLRAPREVKARNRAVTLEDFALLAKETPGALVARASAYISPAANGDVRAINVVIVPQREDAKPVPSEVALRRVCRYLDERRLITTHVKVAGPRYHDIDVVLDVRARDDADLKEVKNAIAGHLADYFHPLEGGEDRQGWPFGRDVYYSELLREIMLIPGVQRVENLEMLRLLPRLDLEGQPADKPFFESRTDAEDNAASLLQAERDAFPDLADDCEPTARVIRVIQPAEIEEEPPTIQWFVAAVYDCCDLPVAEGALVALREAQISVSYIRTRSL